MTLYWCPVWNQVSHHKNTIFTRLYVYLFLLHQDQQATQKTLKLHACETNSISCWHFAVVMAKVLTAIKDCSSCANAGDWLNSDSLWKMIQTSSLKIFTWYALKSKFRLKVLEVEVPINPSNLSRCRRPQWTRWHRRVGLIYFMPAVSL